MIFNIDTNSEGNVEDFAVKEAYRLARTNIEFSIIGENCKTVVITSPDENDGKTTTAINIAGAFSKQINKKVLIIDCDLRKPSVGTYLNVKNKYGLTDYLCKNKEISEIVTDTDIDNMFAILGGETPPNPSELLVSAKMKSLLTQLEGIFDYIIIDTPPVNVVIDALGIARECDGVVAIIKENSTTYRDVDRMLDSFKSAKVNLIGFILNNVDHKKKTYSKKYHRYSEYKDYR